MILRQDIPKNYDIPNTLKHYCKFCVSTIQDIGLEKLTYEHAIVVLGDWEYPVDAELQHNILVTDWNVNYKNIKNRRVHPPMYLTFNTIYKLSSWYKYFDKSDFLVRKDIDTFWLPNICHQSGIIIKNV